MRYAYIQNEQIVEFRDLPADAEVDLNVLRPVIVVPYELPAWQFVRGVHYDIFPDHVDEVAELEDRLLVDVQQERIAQLEHLFIDNRVYGFEFNAHRYPLLQQSTERMDLVRRVAYDPAHLRDSDGVATPLDAAAVNNWLAAGDDALAALYLVHDNHFTAILATTTPEAAATYDITTGWPLSAPPIEPEP